MKKITFLFALALILVSSCKKYPDGPAISLLPKKERVDNTWVLNKAIEDGVDKTGDYQTTFKNYKLTMTKGGDYTLTYTFFFLDYQETGTWVFNSDKTKIIFDPTSNNNANDEWTILRLKEEELWAKDEDFNGKVLEVHLIPD